MENLRRVLVTFLKIYFCHFGMICTEEAKWEKVLVSNASMLKSHYFMILFKHLWVTSRNEREMCFIDVYLF